MKRIAVEIENLKVRDIMRPDVVFAGSDMNIADLVELLEAHNVTGVPVVNGKGKVIGVVSKTDIVTADSWREGGRKGANGCEKMTFPAEKKVEDIMTPWVVSTTEDTLVTEIAQIMVKDKVHRVFVMDSKGHLKGIISSMDLVRLIAEARRV